MKILLINKFLYPKGGDAIVALNTAELLTSKGHKVVLWGMQHSLNPGYPYKDYFVSNIDFDNVKGLKKIRAALNILYSFEAKNKIEKLIKLDKPDIAHLNNFAHQISPSILDVFKKYRIPTVMTMHDYKLVCASYSMLSKDKVCELCRGRKYYHCFLEGCVKDSKAKSLLNTMEMYLHHKILHIYDLVDVFISPSQFLKTKLEEMGFKGKIVHLPNFISLEEYEPQYQWTGGSIVYLGRLSKEKGLFTLIEAMKGLDVKLKIIGEGPIKENLKLKAQSEKLNNIEFLGYRTGEELKNEIRKSMFVVLPSECYENNPRSIIEAFAQGKPVIGSRIGGIPELVKDDITGLLFEPGSSDDLRRCIKYLKSNPDKIVEMGKNSRNLIEKEYNPDAHYKKLIELYESIAR